MLLVALAALAVWLLWPSPAEPKVAAAQPAPAGPREPKEHEPKEHEKKELAKKEPPKKVAAPKPAPPKVAAASLSYVPDREKLLEAIRERSRELAACPLPPGSPPLLPVRVRISRAGEIRSLRMANGTPLPEALASCARAKITAWNFAALQLKSDVETLVSFELGKP
jgi:hypothetical protein